MSVAPINMPVPKVNLSDFISPEEEGKQYIGPNINWEALPGVLLDLLTLADPTGMVGGPAGMVYSKLGTFPKDTANIIKKVVTGLEKENPIFKAVTKNTNFRFMDTAKDTASAMTVSPLDNIIKAYPRKSYKTKSVEETEEMVRSMLLHEYKHLLTADDTIYKYVKDIYANAPNSIKMAMKDAIPPDKILNIVKQSPKEEAIGRVNRWIIGEFASYADEGIQAASGKVVNSKVGRELGKLAQEDPKVMELLVKANNIPPELTTDIVKSLQTRRFPSLSRYLLDTSDYTSDEVRALIKDSQEKIISTSSKGIVKPRTAKAREIIKVEGGELKEPVRGMGGGKDIKEYIPTEPSKTKSIKPMYLGPRDANKDFADDVVKNMKGPIREKAWALIMEHLQEGKP